MMKKNIISVLVILSSFFGIFYLLVTSYDNKTTEEMEVEFAESFREHDPNETKLNKHGYDIRISDIDGDYRSGLKLFTEEELHNFFGPTAKLIHIFDYRGHNVDNGENEYFVFIYKNYDEPDYEKAKNNNEKHMLYAKNMKLYCSAQNRYAILDLRVKPNIFINDLDKKQLIDKMQQMNIDINISKLKKEPSECIK